jgi:hypothetical protein
LIFYYKSHGLGSSPVDRALRRGVHWSTMDQ